MLESAAVQVGKITGENQPCCLGITRLRCENAGDGAEAFVGVHDLLELRPDRVALSRPDGYEGFGDVALEERHRSLELGSPVVSQGRLVPPHAGTVSARQNQAINR